MPLVYKTLFEVKILHEFFLTEKDGKTIFELPNQADRINFLLDEYALERISITNDLQFNFPSHLQLDYKGIFLKLIPGYSGFKVLTRVNARTMPDNSLVYEPAAILPDDLNIYVLLSRNDTSIDSYTNSRIGRSLPSTYFFSNEDILNPKIFPFLTNKISPFNPAYSYEQGELASFGPSDIREYYKNAGGDQWNNISGNEFANENDRFLVPLKFFYVFSNAGNVTQATFVLKDQSANTVKTITVTNTDPIKKSLLDFSDKVDLLSIPEKFSFPAILYSLEVTGNDGYARTHILSFSNTLYNIDDWGILNIRIKATNPLFNLLAPDGFLIKRRDPLGIWTPAPVFEIQVRSRYAYWRYINNGGKELKLFADLTDYVVKENKVLVTVKPRATTRYYFLVQKFGSTDTKYLPNPVNYDIKKLDNDRFCFDIPVPESEIFPIVP